VTKAQLQTLLKVLSEEEATVIEQWLSEVSSDAGARRLLQAPALELLKALREGLQADGDPGTLEGPAWANLRTALDGLSRTRAEQGKSVGDTSLFVLAFKKPLFVALQRCFAADPAALGDVLWGTTLLVDRMAQRTANAHQVAREDVIRRQQQELLELSTPVIKLWDGVLAVPMIGTLDSSRTQIVMETLLQKIVDTESGLAIIDITGVPTVDTLVAQHLMKTVSAIRLMGADCIISGIRPQIAQTIVHLGIDLAGISTKSTLADALALALTRTGYRITREK
jgi:rsbT co-antagonist protein RsbR